jgi:hypothetical protein
VAPPAAAEDPVLTARRLDVETADWCVWWGARTRRFYAITRSGTPTLVHAPTAGELVERMRWATAAIWAAAQRT